jgi:hypothetical protein
MRHENSSFEFGLLQEVRQGCTMVKMETAQTKVANEYSSNSKNGKWDIE